MTTIGRVTPDRRDPAPRRLEADLRFRIGRTHRLVRASWESRIADLGVRAGQAGVLRAIAEQPGTGVRELARRLGTDPMNAKRIADGLERDGLVTSGTSPDDARRRVLSATPAGTELAAELARRAAAWERTLVRRLGADDARRLAALLGRVEDALAGDPSDG